MTDASFTAAGYAILTDGRSEQKITSIKKSQAPIAFNMWSTFTYGPKHSLRRNSRC